MKFLTDQDVYAATSRLLRDLGHDVVTASSIGMAQADDETLLRTAHSQNRILVTRDRDFGALVFVRGTASGVIYLRLSPETQVAVEAELQRVLSIYSESELCQSFVVIEPARHRIRKPTSNCDESSDA